MSDRKGDWIETFTGRKFWPLDPQPEDIDINDIAHGLSQICRFNGQCRFTYTVGQHSLHCANLAKIRKYRDNGRMELLCLLHDAAEAYLNDVTRPTKPALVGYVEIERNIQTVILQALGIAPPTKEEAQIVSAIDDIVLAVEARELMPSRGQGWKLNRVPAVLPSIGIIEEWPKSVERQFLQRYFELRGL